MRYIWLLLGIMLFILNAGTGNKLIELKNGEKIKCEIIKEENGIIFVNSESFGKMEISRSNVEIIHDLNTETGYKYDDPNHNSLLFMPSAETNPKGTKYISSYELLYMNTGFAPVNNLHLSLGFIFPVVPELLTEGPFSFGMKWRIKNEPYKHNISVMGSFTTVLSESEIDLITLGAAFNFYTGPDTTLNFYAGILEAGGENMFNFGAALTHRTSESSKIIFEYLNGMFDTYRSDGILLFGLRFFGERISADLAGVKFLDLDGNSDAWFIIPLVSLTYHF